MDGWVDGVDTTDGWNEADALDGWMGWGAQVLQGMAKSWVQCGSSIWEGSKSSFTGHRAAESPTQTVNVHQ